MEIKLNDSKLKIGATGIEGIAQQIKIVASTRKGSVPFDRSFGVDYSFLDDPVNVAGPKLIVNMIDEIERQVSGVTVKEVILNNDKLLLSNGIIDAVLEVDINESS